LLLLVDRTDDDGVPATEPPWQLSGFYYSEARERFEAVGELSGILLPSSTCCLGNGFYLVAPDGSVVVRGLWRGVLDERTTLSILDASSNRSLCELVEGFCLPLVCPDCGFGDWDARISANQLTLLEIRDGINRNWVPDGTRGPVPLPRRGDPDGPSR
jgi:hypothetical protein